MTGDIVLESFTADNLRSCTLPLITIYRRPEDYPDNYVARLYDLQQPTPYIVLGSDLADIKRKLPPAMLPVSRSHDDPPAVVVSYI